MYRYITPWMIQIYLLFIVCTVDSHMAKVYYQMEELNCSDGYMKIIYANSHSTVSYIVGKQADSETWKFYRSKFNMKCGLLH